jgi:hypothetical protein
MPRFAGIGTFVPTLPGAGKASANLFQRWHAMSRSVWSAPYSGALTSGVPLPQWFRNGFTEALLAEAYSYRRNSFPANDLDAHQLAAKHRFYVNDRAGTAH